MVGVSKLSHWIANIGRTENRNTQADDEQRLAKRRRKAAKIHEKNHGLRPAQQPHHAQQDHTQRR